MFYQGSLQDGIALAVSQSKAVICFVRDEEQLSATWEDEYFASDKEFAQLLEAKAITLRLAKGSEQAGYLTSFCPILKFPAVVVIKNGMLGEYIVPDISKEDFRGRLRTVLGEDSCASTSSQEQVTSSPARTPQIEARNNLPPAAPTPPPQPVTSPPALSQPEREAATAASTTESARSTPVSLQAQTELNIAAETGAHRNENARPEAHSEKVKESVRRQKQEKPKPALSPKPKQKEEEERKQPNIKKPTLKPEETSTFQTTTNTQKRGKPAAPPTQYRLQVRLFDGSSVRSTFTPTQTIRKDVRPWLDEKMDSDPQPYNLKHILTPHPNRTLTIADEEQTLEALNLGASANLVMVPIRTYTEAYAGAGPSIPVRAAGAVYDMASSALGTATGLVGSFFGYGPSPSTAGEPASQQPGSETGRSAPGPRHAVSRGPNIRTLHDQRNERGDSQFYNGNQLNFEPRGNSDQR